jgi:predicted dehydrogenase
MEPVRAALVGIAGIGGYHRELMRNAPDIEFVAAADRWPQRPDVEQAAATLKESDIPLYTDIWQMLDEVSVEACVIATPHPFHAPYTLGCLERGLHVLVEKPLSVLAKDGLDVVAASAKSGLHVAVDFQYTSYPHSLALKEMIVNGELGELREVVGVMEWKRTEEYYLRADWVGRRTYDGLPCWDGVLMNQAVHLLNSALQFGTAEAGLAVPQRLQAELYRIHDIQTEDVAALRGDLGEANLYLYATTCCDADYRTTLDIIGTKGRASWNTEKAVVERDGKEPLVLEQVADRDAIHHNLVQCMRGAEKRLYAPASESVKAPLVINGAYVSAGSIPKLGWDQMAGLRELMDQAAEERKMLAEMPGVPWGQLGEVVEAEAFSTFTGLADDAAVAAS